MKLKPFLREFYNMSHSEFKKLEIEDEMRWIEIYYDFLYFNVHAQQVAAARKKWTIVEMTPEEQEKSELEFKRIKEDIRKRQTWDPKYGIWY